MINEQIKEFWQHQINISKDHELFWLHGYLESYLNLIVTKKVTANREENRPQTISTNNTHEAAVIYLSQTGNSKKVAEYFFDLLKTRNLKVNLFDAAQLKVKSLKKFQFLFFIASTHGEGEPPDSTAVFYTKLLEEKELNLKDNQFAVVGLGDSSYEKFCEVAKAIDKKLEQLGAPRITDLELCDIEYQEKIANWQHRVLQILEKQLTSTANDSWYFRQASPLVTQASPLKPDSVPSHYKARVIKNINLNAKESSKETFHLELETENWFHQPGDAIKVHFKQNEQSIDAFQKELKSVGLETNLKDKSILEQKDLHLITDTMIKTYTEKEGIDEKEALKVKKENRDISVIDFLRYFLPQKHDTLEVVEWLTKLQPRTYSIANSINWVENEVHILVKKIAKKSGCFYGQASNYLAQLPIGEYTTIELKPTPNFHLDLTSDNPIIMIGAGTGVCVFRAFLQEKQVAGYNNKMWLLYGDRDKASDFLYQTEWMNFLAQGILNDLSVSFSRSHTRYKYVYEIVSKEISKLIHWLDKGAKIYICGSIAMGKSVDTAIVDGIKKFKKISLEKAHEEFNYLKQQKRILKDVY